MRSREVGEGALRWSQRWLEPSVVRDVIEPTVADLRFESASPAAARVALGRALLGAIGLSVARRGAATSWWLLLAPAAVLLLATRTLATLSPGKAAQHGAYGVLAFVVAAVVILWPLRAPQALARACAAIVITSLSIVAFAGITADGVTRWVALGPLTVHVAGLLTPLFVAALLHWRPRPALRHAFVAACLGALALQPNLPMVTLWAGVAVAASLPAERRVQLPLSLVAVALTFALTPSGQALSESLVPATTGQHNPMWTLIVMLALWVPAIRAWRGPRPSPAFAALFGLWPLLAYLDEALVLLSFGGSMVVAYLACMGLWMRDLATR